MYRRQTGVVGCSGQIFDGQFTHYCRCWCLWDTSLVEDMALVFWGAVSFNIEGPWDVSRVQLMVSMLSGADEMFNQPLAAWNTPNYTRMGRIFARASSFNQPLPWNVERVADLSAMFTDATSFNQDLSDRLVSSVSDFYPMFLGATAFNQNLCAWGDLIQETARFELIFDDTSCPQTGDLEGPLYEVPYYAICEKTDSES